MVLVDILLVALIFYGLMIGLRRGFIYGAVDLGAFLVAALTASIAFRPLSERVVAKFGIIPSFADILSFALVLVVVELVLVLAAKELVLKIPPQVFSTRLNQIGGAVVGTAKAVFLMAVGVVIFTGLPISAASKQAVTEARIPKLMLAYSGNLQREIDRIIGSSINDTLNFFTVKQEEDFIWLGFTTTDVKVVPELEQAMLARINQERTSRGLKPLVVNEAARVVARAHSKDMFARGYFSHINPDGQDPFERLEEGRVRYLVAGENLALAPTLELAHQGLMNSPGHRANILSPDFGAVGIGVIDGGRYGIMFTQNFTD